MAFGDNGQRKKQDLKIDDAGRDYHAYRDSRSDFCFCSQRNLLIQTLQGVFLD